MAYNRIRHIKETAQLIMEMNGVLLASDLDAEDIEYIGGECQCCYADVCEILGVELPESLKPVAAE